MACTYYEYKSGLFSGDYWCQKKDCRVDSDTYYKYCRNYNYDECPIYKTQERSGCFITTIVCQILGRDDKDPLLNNFRNFRDNFLQQSEKYHTILKEYDVIGPILADCIEKDKDRSQIALGIYQRAIIPINNFISRNEHNKAIETYYLMTLMLVNYYGLKHEYNHLKDEDYNYSFFNPKTAGHGLKKLK